MCSKAKRSHGSEFDRSEETYLLGLQRYVDLVLKFCCVNKHGSFIEYVFKFVHAMQLFDVVDLCLDERLVGADAVNKTD